MARNRAKGIENLLEQVKSTSVSLSMGRICVRPSNQFFKRSMWALSQTDLRASSSMVGIASAFEPRARADYQEDTEPVTTYPLTVTPLGLYSPHYGRASYSTNRFSVAPDPKIV